MSVHAADPLVEAAGGALKRRRAGGDMAVLPGCRVPETPGRLQRDRRAPSPGPTRSRTGSRSSGCTASSQPRPRYSSWLWPVYSRPRRLRGSTKRPIEVGRPRGTSVTIGDERAEALLRLLPLGDVDPGRVQETHHADSSRIGCIAKSTRRSRAVGEPVAQRLAEDLTRRGLARRLADARLHLLRAAPPGRLPERRGRAPRRACTRTSRRRGR